MSKQPDRNSADDLQGGSLHDFVQGVDDPRELQDAILGIGGDVLVNEIKNGASVDDLVRKGYDREIIAKAVGIYSLQLRHEKLISECQLLYEEKRIEWSNSASPNRFELRLRNANILMYAVFALSPLAILFAFGLSLTHDVIPTFIILLNVILIERVISFVRKRERFLHIYKSLRVGPVRVTDFSSWSDSMALTGIENYVHSLSKKDVTRFTVLALGHTLMSGLEEIDSIEASLKTMQSSLT